MTEQNTNFEEVSASKPELTVGDFFEQIRTYDKSKRRELLDMTWNVLNSQKAGDAELLDDSAKALVALIPDSEEKIAEALARQEKKSDFEIAELLFGALDQTLDLNKRFLTTEIKDYVKKLPDVMGDYIENVKPNKTAAAAVAAKSLATRQPLAKAFPVLLYCALKSRYVDGRDAAVDGLERILPRLSSKWKRLVKASLEIVQSYDKSEALKKKAAEIIARNFE